MRTLSFGLLCVLALGACERGGPSPAKPDAAVALADAGLSANVVPLSRDVWENAGGNTLLEERARQAAAARARFANFQLPPPQAAQGDQPIAQLFSTKLKDAVSWWSVQTFGTRRFARASIKNVRQLWVFERDGQLVSKWALEPADVEWILGDATVEELKSERTGETAVARSSRVIGFAWSLLVDEGDRRGVLGADGYLFQAERACGRLEFPAALRDAIAAAPLGPDAEGRFTVVSLRSVDEELPGPRRGGVWRLEGPAGARKLVPVLAEVDVPLVHTKAWTTLAEWYGPKVADVLSRFSPRHRAFLRNRMPCGEDWLPVEAAGLRLLRFGETGPFHHFDGEALVELPSQGFERLHAALQVLPLEQRNADAVVALLPALALGKAVVTEAERDALGPERSPPPLPSGGLREVRPVDAAALARWHAPKVEGGVITLFVHHEQAGFFRVTVTPAAVTAERLADPYRVTHLVH